MSEENKLIKFPPYKGYKLEGHPPGGRCMPNRCYCQRCPGYVPIDRSRAEVESLAADLTKNNAKHASSWADRKETTWMEKQ